MSIAEQIQTYIGSQSEPKQADMRELHRLALQLAPSCKLWFTDGKNEQGKTVANPNIGYGSYIINYADGKTREFYQVGFSANTTGISVYIMGLEDKSYLAATFGKTIGKASVSGYCIKFKSLKAVNIDVLKTAIEYGLRSRQG
ncbi:MAG: DUF1801 domain-containing protein [Fimbriimonadaceae bacterium]